jgi:hypothetical protein
LRLLFPYDISALYHALRWSLTETEAERYFRFWYDDAGVSVVSRSQTVSRTSVTCSLPHYYGQDVILELPKRIGHWLETVQTCSTFYQRLNVEAHASKGRLTFIVEETGHTDSVGGASGAGEWSSCINLWISHEILDGPAETKSLGWITSAGVDREQAAREVLEELKRIVRYMYGEKHSGLF